MFNALTTIIESLSVQTSFGFNSTAFSMALVARIAFATPYI